MLLDGAGLYPPKREPPGGGTWQNAPPSTEILYEYDDSTPVQPAPPPAISGKALAQAEVAKWQAEVNRLKPLVATALAQKKSADSNALSASSTNSSAESDLHSAEQDLTSKVREEARFASELASAKAALQSAIEAFDSLERSRKTAVTARAAAKQEFERINADTARVEAGHERTRLANERSAQAIASMERERLAAEARRIVEMEARKKTMESHKASAEREVVTQEKLDKANKSASVKAATEKARCGSEFTRIGNGLYPPVQGSEMAETARLQMENEMLAAQIAEHRAAKEQEKDITEAMFVERLAEEESARQRATELARAAMVAAAGTQVNSVILTGASLDGKDRGGKSDPYFEVKSSAGAVLYKSETIKKTVAPTWKPFTLKLSDFGGPNGEVKIEVYDWDRFTSNDLIGETTIKRSDVHTGEAHSWDLGTAKRGPGVKTGILQMAADPGAQQTERKRQQAEQVVSSCCVCYG
jgi:hypothetical protein